MHSYSVRKLVPPTVLSVRIVPKCRTTVYIIVGCLFPAFRKIIRLKKNLYECFPWFFPGSGSPRDHHRSAISYTHSIYWFRISISYTYSLSYICSLYLFLIFVPYISVLHNRSVYLLHIYLFHTFIPYICFRISIPTL